MKVKHIKRLLYKIFSKLFVLSVFPLQIPGRRLHQMRSAKRLQQWLPLYLSESVVPRGFPSPSMASSPRTLHSIRASPSLTYIQPWIRSLCSSSVRYLIFFSNNCILYIIVYININFSSREAINLNCLIESESRFRKRLTKLGFYQEKSKVIHYEIRTFDASSKYDI